MDATSVLRPLSMSPPLVRSRTWSEGCYAHNPLVRSYLLLREEQFLKKYGAITTWGSVFSNPVLKPSHV